MFIHVRSFSIKNNLVLPKLPSYYLFHLLFSTSSISLINLLSPFCPETHFTSHQHSLAGLLHRRYSPAGCFHNSRYPFFDSTFFPEEEEQQTNFLYFTTQTSNPQKVHYFLYQISSKHNRVSSPQQQHQKTQSLSEQLKPLSSTLISESTNKYEESNPTQLLSKPKSIWVNPTKLKRSVLSLQRHKRSPYTYNPQVRDLKLFVQKLNDCESSEAAFMAALEDIPHPLTRENALIILNGLKPWPKAHLFLNLIKTQKLFPLKTIFYNAMALFLAMLTGHHLYPRLLHRRQRFQADFVNRARNYKSRM